MSDQRQSVPELPQYLKTFSDKEFASYLNMLAEDFQAAGMHSTAADYREAARRINHEAD